MRKTIVNAPTQNKEFSPDHKLGKMVPFFVADWLRENEQDCEQQVPIDLWNNVLASEQKGHDQLTYARAMDDRIQRKYGSKLLTAARLDAPRPLVLTDTDEDFSSWAQNVIEGGVLNGALRHEDHDVHVCSNCDGIIAEASSPCTNGCVACGTTATHIENRPVLVSTIDEAAELKVDQATGTTHLKMADVRRSIVNRPRLNGISLERFGFKNEVVDPRVGLGLLAVYATSFDDADQVDIVASRATTRQNLAYFYAAIGEQADEMPQLRIRGIAKAPVEHIAYMRSEGLVDDDKFKHLMRDVLPPELLAMKHDMSPQTLERLAYSRKNNKYLQKSK